MYKFSLRLSLINAWLRVHSAPPVRQSASPSVHNTERSVSSNTHAYIIYKHTALILLNEFNKASIIQKPIDNWIFTILADNNVDVHSTLPLLCHSPLIGDSDIR